MKLSDQIHNEILSALYLSGLSQKQLGKLIGVGEPRISQILSGKRNITLKTADRILEALEAQFKFEISTIKGAGASAIEETHKQPGTLRPVEALSNFEITEENWKKGYTGPCYGA